MQTNYIVDTKQDTTDKVVDGEQSEDKPVIELPSCLTNPEEYQKLQRIILKFIKHRVHNFEDAEDLCSETFMRRIKYPPRVKPDSEEKYLCKIARNLINDFYKANAERNTNEVPLDAPMRATDDPKDAPTSGSEIPDDNFTDELVISSTVARDFMDSLNPREKNTFEHYGVSWKQVSAMKDCPWHSSTAFYKARSVLRAKIITQMSKIQ